MREIKFRGKRVDNGEWAYGLPLYSVVGGKAIIDTIQSCEDLCFYTVIPETVGQYTGLKDKNGKEIFEGDILKIINGTTVADFHYSTLYHIEHHPVEIIGNIYENPKLMEENNENN